MTPERKVYLAKCNAKERRLRDLIQSGKSSVKRLKGYLRTSTDYPRTIQFIALRSIKTELLAFRHELQRLKGMDNVVVPRQVRMATYPASHGFGFGYECVAIGLCACGAPLRDDECKYCQRCGKRVLWEKVKQSEQD